MADPRCAFCDGRPSIEVIWSDSRIELFCNKDAPMLAHPDVVRIMILELDDIYPELQGHPDQTSTVETPRQRWGTCCPNDPECEHSFLDAAELVEHLDTPMKGES